MAIGMDMSPQELDLLVLREELGPKIEALAKKGIKLQDIPLPEGGTSKIIDVGTRPMVVVDVNGVNVPFYISTGSGGKANVASGQWYPILGIGPDGWFNKGSESQINNSYGLKKLDTIARELGKELGDYRWNSLTPRVNEREGPHLNVINKDFTPMYRLGFSPEVLDKNLGKVREALGGNENSAHVGTSHHQAMDETINPIKVGTRPFNPDETIRNPLKTNPDQGIIIQQAPEVAGKTPMHLAGDELGGQIRDIIDDHGKEDRRMYLGGRGEENAKKAIESLSHRTAISQNGNEQIARVSVSGMTGKELKNVLAVLDHNTIESNFIKHNGQTYLDIHGDHPGATEFIGKVKDHQNAHITAVEGKLSKVTSGPDERVNIKPKETSAAPHSTTPAAQVSAHETTVPQTTGTSAPKTAAPAADQRLPLGTKVGDLQHGPAPQIPNVKGGFNGVAKVGHTADARMGRAAVAAQAGAKLATGDVEGAAKTVATNAAAQGAMKELAKLGVKQGLRSAGLMVGVGAAIGFGAQDIYKKAQEGKKAAAAVETAAVAVDAVAGVIPGGNVVSSGIREGMRWAFNKAGRPDLAPEKSTLAQIKEAGETIVNAARYKSMSENELKTAIGKDETLPKTVKVNGKDVPMTVALEDKNYRKEYIAGMEASQAKCNVDLNQQIAMVKAYDEKKNAPAAPTTLAQANRQSFEMMPLV